MSALNKEVRMFHGRDDWFDLWHDDKQSILDTMVKNMVSDLDAGYNYFGNSISKQRVEISKYKEQFESETMSLYAMTADEANRWCFYDMLRRGAIDI